VGREIVAPDTALAFRAMKALRTNLDDAETFIRRVDDVQRAEGYRLVGVFEERSAHAVSVAGFRIAHNLAWGHDVYVDDLSTLADARGRGHARRLLEWLVDEGRRAGCTELHLDSGVGLHRADAHGIYLNAGLVISSHHFARRIAEDAPAGP
jgi:GNAT superfamily N-acetyltransferase